MNPPRPRIFIITGPTAAGKTRASLAAAHALEKAGLKPVIISADSVQVYRYMDVGSDKLGPDKREGVEHHMIDVVDPDQTFSAADFAKMADEIITHASRENGAVLVAGGTGFYLRVLLHGLFSGPSRDQALRERLIEEAREKGLSALHDRLKSLDPESARRVHPNDGSRIVRALEVFELTGRAMTDHFEAQKKEGPRYRALAVGLEMDRDLVYEKINERVDCMLGAGLIEEVRRLREMGYGPALPSQKALGYRQAHMLLDGLIGEEEAAYLIKRDTRHYARRQLTWLRKENLEWTPVDEVEKIAARAVEFLAAPD